MEEIVVPLSGAHIDRPVSRPRSDRLLARVGDHGLHTGSSDRQRAYLTNQGIIKSSWSDGGCHHQKSELPMVTF